MNPGSSRAKSRGCPGFAGTDGAVDGKCKQVGPVASQLGTKGQDPSVRGAAKREPNAFSVETEPEETGRAMSCTSASDPRVLGAVPAWAGLWEEVVRALRWGLMRSTVLLVGIGASCAGASAPSAQQELAVAEGAGERARVEDGAGKTTGAPGELSERRMGCCGTTNGMLWAQAASLLVCLGGRRVWIAGAEGRDAENLGVLQPLLE